VSRNAALEGQLFHGITGATIRRDGNAGVEGLEERRFSAP